jgi:hypothetical protein
MNLLCEIGFHKWKKVIINKRKFPMGKHWFIDIFICTKCLLYKRIYNYDKLLKHIIKKFEVIELKMKKNETH